MRWERRTTLKHGWDLIIFVATTLTAVEVPARLVLSPSAFPSMGEFDWIITGLFACDLVLNLRKRPVPKARERSGPAAGSLRWLVWLAVDAVAAAPLFALSTWPWLQLLRLVKLARVAEIILAWRHRQAEIWNYVRLVVLFYWLGLFSHWLSCGWVVLHGRGGAVSDLSVYVRALYWCIQTLTTVGYGDITPTTNWEFGYAMLVMLFGVGIYGYLIGNIANMLANMDPAKSHYLENMERLNAFMRYRQIPTQLQKRIRDYYSYLWTQRLGYDEAAVLASLSPSLMREVSLFLKHDILQKVPFLKDASEEFVAEIVLQMRAIVYTPGDYVVRVGEVGHEMFFVSNGTLEVLGRDPGIVYTTLTGGDFFGEMALLLDQPRSASVRAVDYCDLYVLDKEMFASVLARYPAFAEHINEVVRRRREQLGPSNA
jgi:hypothetical protein